MTKDPRNPTGSDIIAERLHKERKGKKEPKKKRHQIISFEVTAHKPHPKPHVQKARANHAPTQAKTKQKTHTVPTWRRVAVWIFIILLIMWYFTNNYMKNVTIEDLQSENEELTQTYDEQAQKITELEAQVSRMRGAS